MSVDFTVDDPLDMFFWDINIFDSLASYITWHISWDIYNLTKNKIKHDSLVKQFNNAIYGDGKLG